MRPPGIERFAGGYDYYCEKISRDAAGQLPRKPTNATKSGGSDRKAERRERAQKLQEFSRRKRKLEKVAADAEKSADALTREQEELMAKLRSRGPDTDYETINKRLAEIQREMDVATRTWDEATTDLQRIQARYEMENESTDSAPTLE